MIRLSGRGKSLLKLYEALRLTAYLDGGGVPTIGWGHTRGVKLGQTVTLERAELFFLEDIYDSELCVNRVVHKPISQDQFDALVSLTFNIGVAAFTKSTLLRKLNAGDIIGAGNQFGCWVFDNGKIVQGLIKRRKFEKTLFLHAEDNMGTLISSS